MAAGNSVNGARGHNGANSSGDGFGKASMGNYPNWQTMNPIEREKLEAAQQSLPSVASAKAEWPAWVRIEKPTSLAAE
jgi:hypothetical protein